MHTLIGHGVSKQLENQSHVSIIPLNLNFSKIEAINTIPTLLKAKVSEQYYSSILDF